MQPLEFKEFVGDDAEEAAERAARHFGVPVERLDLRRISDRLDIAGLGGRAVVLASVREEQAALGPAGDFVRGILQRMDLPGRVRVDEAQVGGETVVTLSGDGVRDLRRGDGRNIEALSHLADRAAQKLIGEEAVARVTLAAEAASPGDSRLEALARAKADEVLRTGKALELQPMGSRERWVVHNALKDKSGLTTSSVGEGRQKRVRIEPS
jgi:spoIIIJ-associated protein